ncbi:MAG TPA: TauD/TfdA family dioxygenase [Rhodospirillaceae bacterium]|nr:taurine catabolism dioxygenase [Rhodospirillaceae bacterium]HAA92645.1 TauD/TfdA family dioxygenase [Rhodospirillaceae bacterium]HAT36840.1 TauD/TfdA family dioxygenase [Rhodospirillaceae bacterium]
MVNRLEDIEVIPTGNALGAEIKGLDWSEDFSDEVLARFNEIWAEHLVVLIRDQPLERERVMEVADELGGRYVPGSRQIYLDAGMKPGSHRVSDIKGLGQISNLNKDGKPQKHTEGSGSLAIAWHTDNSYMEEPPKASMLNAVHVPVDGGGHTMFANQYLAYDELSDELKETIEGKHILNDISRNTAGRARMGLELPKSRDEVKGPIHPMVRIHPVTKKRCLYLGRRWARPSSYIVEMPTDEGDDLLDILWAHATQEKYVWVHDTWTPTDLVIWDNICTLHRRNEVDPKQKRYLHRACVTGGPVISAFDVPKPTQGVAAAE